MSLKSCIQETLNILMCAKKNTATKKKWGGWSQGCGGSRVGRYLCLAEGGRPTNTQTDKNVDLETEFVWGTM